MSMKLAVGLFLLNQAMAFPKDCPNVTVIHDHNSGTWYDGCLGLTPYPKIDTSIGCEKFCKEDVTCSVWQFVKPGDARRGCWAGYPTEGCRSRASKEALVTFENQLEGGQRLQHGFIKVYKNIPVKGKLIKGLKKLDFVSKETDEKEAKRCQSVCYTDTTCTAWQLYRAPAKRFCFVEHVPGNKKGEIVEPGTGEAKFYIEGEVIEHTCPPYVPPKKEKKGLPWPWIIAGSLLGLAALTFCLMFACQKTPKVKKTRAVKIEAAKEEPAPAPVTYFVPQPTMLIPQQSVIMQQPLVQQQVIQQPVQTVPVAQYTSVPQVMSTQYAGLL